MYLASLDAEVHGVDADQEYGKVGYNAGTDEAKDRERLLVRS